MLKCIFTLVRENCTFTYTNPKTRCRSFVKLAMVFTPVSAYVSFLEEEDARE